VTNIQVQMKQASHLTNNSQPTGQAPQLAADLIKGMINQNRTGATGIVA
jgi:hypothetical protein